MRFTPWRDRYLALGAPDIHREEYDEVIACLDSGWVGTGPRVTRLEEAFRAYVGSPRSRGAQLVYRSVATGVEGPGLSPGIKEIITSTMTFCATVNAIVHAGHVPVLVDCDRATMNLDVEAVSQRITPRTRASHPGPFRRPPL